MTDVKLPSTCTIKVDDQDYEIFMSFALLNRIAFLVGNPDHVHTIMLNPEMREAVLRELISPRDKKGKVSKVVEIYEVEISLEDIQKALDFTADHVMDFTVRAMARSAALQNRNQSRITEIQKSISPSIQTGQAS